MSFNKANLIAVSVAALAAVNFSSCVKKSSTSVSGKLLQINESGSQDLSAEAGTPAALCSYLKGEGYYTGKDYAPGTEVAFSTSYNTDTLDSNAAEAGQAYGKIGSDGFFAQDGMTTTQLLLCPGSFGGMTGGGKCAWKMNGEDGYGELAYRVACNSAVHAEWRSNSKVHRGYTAMKASKVNFTANTAGKSFSHSDAVKLELTNGGNSTAYLYFSKNIGLVASEFREQSAPSGTVKVYIGSNGSTRE